MKAPHGAFLDPDASTSQILDQDNPCRRRRSDHPRRSNHGASPAKNFEIRAGTARSMMSKKISGFCEWRPGLGASTTLWMSPDQIGDCSRMPMRRCSCTIRGRNPTPRRAGVLCQISSHWANRNPHACINGNARSSMAEGQNRNKVV